MSPVPSLDVNALVFEALREMAAVQTVRPKAQAFARAAATVFGLEQPLPALRDASGALPKLPGLGPSSLRVVEEVLATGRSASADAAVAASRRAADIAAQRAEGRHAISRARVVEILADRAIRTMPPSAYRGDLQMHTTWSDGQATVAAMAEACAGRGYEWMAVTDHAGGLAIAGAASMADVRRQHEEIDRLNATRPACRVLKGIEANIAADGQLDLTDGDLAAFDIVLAAPHSQLRVTNDQTARLLRVVRTPGVHVLAHPRGRKIGARGGIVADWDAVFAEAARRQVAIEIDGFAERQDLDHVLAARALAAGCLFALDSDAHAPDQLLFAETAIAHARLAGIPAARVVNTWPIARVLDWADARRQP